MLYLVATPIGNLADISYRAIDVLKSCDYILCEDTRHSLFLLKHYGIEKPLKSFHKFIEAKKESAIISDLQNGKVIALISDAGTPGIADPGQRLVKECVENNLAVIAIPGACAAIQALSCSGMNTERFQFLGFLPKKNQELRQILIEILQYPGTTICYESPKRLMKTLEILKTLDSNRSIAVLREMTKKFEEFKKGNAEEIIHHYSKGIQGEIVLLISEKKEKIDQECHLSYEEHVKKIQQEYGLTLLEAIKLVAKIRNVPKREVYGQIHKN